MAKAKGISEAQWQAQVLGLAGFYGWRAYHPPDNTPSASGRRQRVAPGFPDLVLVRGPALIFAELKAEHGRLGPGQQEWLEDLGRVAAAVALELDERDNAQREAGGYGSRPLEDPRIGVYLWRPSDFEAVQATLGRGRALVRPEWAPAE